MLLLELGVRLDEQQDTLRVELYGCAHQSGLVFVVHGPPKLAAGIASRFRNGMLGSIAGSGIARPVPSL